MSIKRRWCRVSTYRSISESSSLCIERPEKWGVKFWLGNADILQPIKAACQEKNLPPLPLYGGLSLLQAGRECFLAVSLTRFFQGMAPDTMIRTIQPNGLYATADLYGLSRRRATRAKHAPEDHRYRTGLIHIRMSGWPQGLHQLFPRYRPGQIKGKGNREGKQSPITPTGIVPQEYSG